MLLEKALDRKPGVVYPEKNREEAAAMQEAQELKQELFRRLAAEGAAQMGVADLRGLVPSELETGVAVLVSLPRDLVRALQTAPTRAYYAAYHTHPQCPAGPDRDPGGSLPGAGGLPGPGSDHFGCGPG